jgi:YhcH/YjgK/YiaL family protein
MIYVVLEHAHLYSRVHELLDVATAFLSRDDLEELPEGRHELRQGAYASIQSYRTKPVKECVFESHRRYIDIQYVIEGEEWIYVSRPDSLPIMQEYDESGDCILYEGTEGTETTRALMRPEAFLVLFPHDAHMPTVAVDGPAPVRKAVVKIPV